MGVEELRGVVRGGKVGYVAGMRGVGECLFVSTDRGVLEVRECLEKKTGGLLLCRVF